MNDERNHSSGWERDASLPDDESSLETAVADLRQAPHLLSDVGVDARRHQGDFVDLDPERHGRI